MSRWENTHLNMFYLTYRPQTIGELDNTQVAHKLASFLSKGSVPHAFLLIGHKGMGKTSTARIIAKAINCKKNRFGNPALSEFEPCNKCESCKAINGNYSADVTEMDAASNRGIDDIRKLVNDSGFSPMHANYRVYIIDEAHMITTEGFNALLKTLEEPASTAIFILATTNEEKIPPTIASRCIKISFGQATRTDLSHMIDRILTHEKKSVSPPLKELIISQSDESFRDAAKLLEEVIIHNISDVEEALKYFGISNKQDFLDTLLGKGMKETLQWLQSFHANGGDVKSLIVQSMHTLRRHILSLNSIPTDPPDSLTLSLGHTMRLLKLLSESYKLMKSSPIELLPLEICVAEFYAIRDNEKK